LRFAADELPGLLPGRSAVIDGGMERLGVLGELDPSIAAAFDFRGGGYLFEIDVGAVARALERHPRRYQPVSRYPAVEEDLSFLVDAACPAGDLAAEIEAAPLVERAAVFDVYTGEGLPAGKKSIAFSVTYRAPDRTLTNDDIGRTRRRLVERLAREFGAELRGGP
ncbi:MAG TPA: phenylalanine--tRNA ligase subunit beta, partial [Dehalococcoidia bacterium]|nr:phenylalanine--tRNA ligase subunit beta [Dehalococcoidia bacterium]